VRNRVRGPTQCGIIALTTRCTKGGCKLDDGRRMPGAGLSCCRLRKAPPGKPAFQPYWENPPYGMIGRIEETSASSKPDPRLDPTRLPLPEVGQPTRSPHCGREQRRRCGGQFFMSNFLLAPRSHRRRYSIPTDPPRATLQRSIGLLDRGDEDFRARLEIALVPLHVNNNGRTGGDKDFLFSVLVFQRQRLPINPSDSLFNVRVGHCAQGPKIPWVVSFSGSAHSLGQKIEAVEKRGYCPGPA